MACSTYSEIFMKDMLMLWQSSLSFFFFFIRKTIYKILRSPWFNLFLFLIPLMQSYQDLQNLRIGELLFVHLLLIVYGAFSSKFFMNSDQHNCSWLKISISRHPPTTGYERLMLTFGCIFIKSCYDFHRYWFLWIKC